MVLNPSKASISFFVLFYSETHNAPMPNAQNFFTSLHDAGYVITSKEANYDNQAGAAEYAFLKLSTDFFINQTMYKYMDISQYRVP